MKEVFKKIRERLETEKAELTTWAEDMAFKLGINKAIEIVNQVEREYKSLANNNQTLANDGWIPCSDKLPERNELVLIYAESTARGGSIRCVASYHNGFWFTQTSSDTLSLCGIGQYQVIAWQPLPEPYKGE